MKVLVAIDSFKGSVSSVEAGRAAAKGILKANPEAEVIVKPLADGGEGTTEVLIEGLGGELVSVPVKAPMGNEIIANYGIVDGNTAIIEMAKASGITLVDPDKLNPWEATSYGTGQLVLDALNKGIRKFIIGIGGSATTEGGIGFLSSLGVEFFESDNWNLLPKFSSLEKIARISTKNMPEALNDSTFEIASDVTNPLTGKLGAINVFGQQKGVKPEEIAEMDSAMKHYAEVTKETIGKDYSESEGAGAAGGLGFAFLSFIPNTTLKPGFEVISDLTGLENELKDCDIVLTGEGRLDSQSVMGKAPISLAKLARKNGVKTVIAIAGSVDSDAVAVNNEGITAFFSILHEVSTLEEAMNKETTLSNIELTTEEIFRLLQ